MTSIINHYGYSNQQQVKSLNINERKFNSIAKNRLQKDTVNITKHVAMISFKGRKLDVIPYKRIITESTDLIKRISHVDSISALEKADSVIFMAHPDDEIFFSIIPELIEKGHSVQLIYASGGEKGLRYEGAPPSGVELAKYRENELVNALQKLGISRDAVVLDFPDSGVHKGDNPQKMSELFHKILERTKPEFVFTFAPDGITKNPDHIAVGKTVFNLIRNKNQGNRAIQLYHTVMSKTSFKNFQNSMKNANTYSWTYLQHVSNRVVKLKSDTKKYAKSISDAAYQHRSQWNAEETKGFNEFYSNNGAEFTTLKRFKTPKTLTSPWEEGEKRFKKKYGNEFSILLCDGVNFKPKGVNYDFNLYLADFGKNKKTLWLEDPTLNSDGKNIIPIDTSKYVFENIKRIKKIPQFKSLECIAFNIAPITENGKRYKLSIPVKECKNVASYLEDICKNCELGLEKYKNNYPKSKITIE